MPILRSISRLPLGLALAATLTTSAWAMQQATGQPDGYSPPSANPAQTDESVRPEVPPKPMPPPGEGVPEIAPAAFASLLTLLVGGALLLRSRRRSAETASTRG